jgi:hypothetical protein
LLYTVFITGNQKINGYGDKAEGYMNSIRINTDLILFFVFALAAISPLSAEPLPGEEPVLIDEPLISEEPLHGDELIITDEAPPGMEPLLSGEDFFSDEHLLFEAPPLIIKPGIEPRSFDEIFPHFLKSQKRAAMSKSGLRYSFEKDESPMLLPDPASGIDLLTRVMEKNPSHIIAALVVVPYNEKEVNLLDVYNAMRRISNISDPQISSNGSNINTFVGATRLESAKNRKSIADPSPADILPYSETMYLRLVDQYIGDLYIRADISMDLHGLIYSMTNFRGVSYFIFRIMKAEGFSAFIYFEPVKEGLLVYSMSGLYLPGFIINRVNLTPNMNRRITILTRWITDGL